MPDSCRDRVRSSFSPASFVGPVCDWTGYVTLTMDPKRFALCALCIATTWADGTELNSAAGEFSRELRVAELSLDPQESFQTRAGSL